MFRGFEFVSIWWTFPAIAISLLLLKRYGPPSIATVIKVVKGDFKSIAPKRWIGLGIAVCFAGSVIDNGYWFIPWTLKYIGANHGDFFDAGVYVNVPFRQAPLIIGSALHVAAEALANPNLKKRKRRLIVLWRTFWISSLIGLVFTIWATIISTA